MASTIIIGRNDSKPIYSHIKEHFKKRIKQGKLKPLDRLPSEIAVAAKYNISRMTARQAFIELENEGLIFRKQGKGTFVSEFNEAPWQRIRGTMSSRILAILLPCITEHIYSKILRGIEDVAEERGYNVLICNTDFDSEKENKYIQKVNEHKVGGLIIVPGHRGNMSIERYARLRADNVPFVFVDRFVPEIDADYVVADNVLGAYEAVSHLIDLGHKRIAYISVPRYSVTEQRLEGYRRALQESRIIFDESLIKAGDTVEKRPGYACMKELWESKNCPTAVFAFNDTVARQVYEAAMEFGVSIPGHLALVGFDDSPVASIGPVPLTTVAYPSYEIGTTSTSILIDRIEGKIRGVQRVNLKPELVLRDSCGGKLRGEALAGEEVEISIEKSNPLAYRPRSGTVPCNWRQGQ